MERYEQINGKLAAGYRNYSNNKSEAACIPWLEAWEEIKIILQETGMTMLELQKAYPWLEHLLNYVQDLEMELHNAGIDNTDYFKKRIRYCEEVLEQKELPADIYEGARSAIGESYFELDDIETAEQFYRNWLTSDPQWGYGYLSWSHGYAWAKQNPSKAKEILETALAVPQIRNRQDLLNRMVEICKELAEPEALQKYQQEQKQFEKTEKQQLLDQTQRKVESIGRNDPCLCGSGIKYKKCCGA